MCDYLYTNHCSIIGIIVSLFALFYAFKANKNASNANKKAQEILLKTINTNVEKQNISLDMILNLLEEFISFKSTPETDEKQSSEDSTANMNELYL